ncbi:MAG: zf-HC2 domain-containing protein [Micromonosporaceae bacterium]|nr:zf-HC2 domain-containing protein [Micromonosporaceae bacterium]
MECDECREILSARLDGEDLPGEATAADAHVATCDACAHWWEAATQVTRLARLSTVPGPGPVSERLAPERLAAAAPGPANYRLAMGLRWLLGLLGLGQFLLGIAQVSALSATGHEHLGGLSPAHLWHESAAWNIAVGAGFGWIALRRTPPNALLPLLTAFVVMLVLLSVNDVLVGTVDGARLVSHALVAVGYLVLVALSRPRFDFGDPPAYRRPGPVRPVGDRARGQTPRPATTGPRPPLRLVTRAQPAPTARRSMRPVTTARTMWPRPVTAVRPVAARWDRAA